MVAVESSIRHSGVTAQRRKPLLGPGMLAAVLLATPALVVLGIFFFYPLLLLFIQSFEGGSFASYVEIAENPVYLNVFLKTFKIAAIVSAIDLMLAYPLAFYLARASNAARAIGFLLVLLPLWTSQLVRTYAWMVLLGRNGVVNRALMGAGVIDAPLPLLNNELAVVIGMSHILLPFMILPIYSAVTKLDRTLADAAYGMGASHLQVIRRIYLPLTAPGILAGVALVFVLSLGAFIMPALLGGGRVPVIPLLIEQQTTRFLDWPFSGALSAVLLLSVLLLFWLLNKAAAHLAGARADG